MTRKVVLKGDAFTVARCLALAGIPFVFDRQAGANTVGRVNTAFIPKLSKYLANNPNMEGRFTK